MTAPDPPHPAPGVVAGEATEAGHLAALAGLPHLGPARLRWLLSESSGREAWKRLGGGRLRHGGSAAPPQGVLHQWRAVARSEPDLPRRMEARLRRLGVDVLTAAELPEPLARDHDPPAVLFARGAVAAIGCATGTAGRGAAPGGGGVEAGGGAGAERARVAVVGTRRATSYGLRVAEQLGRELSGAGVTVVSGLALGIDAAAHRGALAGTTPVIAVAGAGHDRPCPSRNRGLAGEVVQHGALLSEVPPGVASAPWRFPVRNRLIAALAHIVVVVESASAGGSMTTVTEALARDRSVMAVPGPVGRRASEGCHDLLRDGAEVCSGAVDVLTLLDLLGVAPPTVGVHRAGSSGAADGPAAAAPTIGLSATAVAVVDLLADGSLPLDGISSRTGAALAELSGAVAELECAGLVARAGGWVELVGRDP